MGRRKVEWPGEVLALRERIEAWRLGRVGRSRMPEAFWAEALTWARLYGACAISRALGIGYAGLRARLGSAPKTGGTEALGGGFVEVSNVWAGGGSSTVEVMGPQGGRLLMNLTPGNGLDVASVVAAFMRSSA